MKIRTDKRTGKRGFTLTELLVVIAIITILATIAIPNLIGNIEKGRMAGALADVKNADTSLRSMLSDAGINRFQDLLSPAARYMVQNYDDPVNGLTDPHPVTLLEPEKHMELLYRTMFYTLLRVGRDASLPANVDGDMDTTPPYGLRELFTGMTLVAGVNQDPVDPYFFGDDNEAPADRDPVFNRALVNKLRTSYMDIGTDSWGNQYHFWMGPLDRGTPANPVPLRSFRINPVTPTAPYQWNTDRRNEAQQVVAGQPAVDNENGYPAPIDFPVYVWSRGPNGELDAHVDLLTSNDPGYTGGGDDINNWDTEAGWQSAPRPLN